MAMVERVPIGADATTGQLHDTLARLGADLMVRALGALERGTLQLTPQPEAGVTYAKKIDKAETPDRLGEAVEGGARPHPRAVAVSRRVVRTARRGPRESVAQHERRGPDGAIGTALDDRLTVACSEGSVRIVELQKAGSKAMQADEFLRGTPVAQGTRLL